MNKKAIPENGNGFWYYDYHILLIRPSFVASMNSIM